MTILVARASDTSPHFSKALPLTVGVGTYLLLLFAGSRLLNDPDTLWQITVGQWIIDHGVRPTHLNGHQYMELVPGVAELIPELLDLNG